jgi:hypothetical protein
MTRSSRSRRRCGWRPRAGVCPGAIRAPALTGGKFGRIPGISDEELLKSWERLRPMAPEKFAERALRAVLRGDAIIVVPASWKTWWYLERASPAPPTPASAARHTSIRICVRHLDDGPPTAIRLDPATHPRARRSGRYRASRDRTVSMASTARSLSTAWIAITGMYSSSGKSIRAQR